MKLELGSIDAEFHVDSKNAPNSDEILSRSQDMTGFVHHDIYVTTVTSRR